MTRLHRPLLALCAFGLLALATQGFPESARDDEAPALTALQMDQELGQTAVRFTAEGSLDPFSVTRAADRFVVSLPAVDLSAVAGSWRLNGPEIVALSIGDTDAEPGIELHLAPGVWCDLGIGEPAPETDTAELEIVCRSPPAELPDAAAPVELPGAAAPVELPGAAAPVELPGAAAPVELPGAAAPVELPGDTPPPESEPALPASPAEPPPLVPDDTPDDLLLSASPPPSEALLVAEQPLVIPEPTSDTPERVSLDFRDADLRDVLRVLSEVSGLDFVLQPGVSGRVSLRLTETPWDQALDVVLRTLGLGHVLEGGVLRVGELAELAAERMERQRHEEQSELAGELVTLRRTLAHVSAENVRDLLEASLSDRGTLIADPRTGTLLVSDVAPRVSEMELVLDALDIPVPEVEIEARIVLATRTLTQRLGIQWGASAVRQSDEEGANPSLLIAGHAIGAASSSFTTGGGGAGVQPPVDANGGRPGYGVNLPISGAPTGVLGIAMAALDGAARLDLALSAAEKKGEVRILSAPRIVAQNARSATIKQGVTFPVQVVANNTVTVQFRDAVLELTVTPQVSPDGTVVLDLLVSNDSLDFGQSVGGIPSIVTQHATTRVRVVDGDTAVLGGVFSNQESQERNRVPGLHRIPLLGHLFRSREENHRNEELLIFLTPRIRPG